jgi:hypothetical protein
LCSLNLYGRRENYYTVSIHNKMSYYTESYMSFSFFFFNFNKQRKPTLLLLRICMVKSQNCQEVQVMVIQISWAIVAICIITGHIVGSCPYLDLRQHDPCRCLNVCPCSSLSLSRFIFLKIKRNKPNLFSTLFLKSKYM